MQRVEEYVQIRQPVVQVASPVRRGAHNAFLFALLCILWGSLLVLALTSALR